MNFVLKIENSSKVVKMSGFMEMVSIILIIIALIMCYFIFNETMGVMGAFLSVLNLSITILIAFWSTKYEKYETPTDEDLMEYFLYGKALSNFLFLVVRNRYSYHIYI